jgi:hypothetical protein
MSSTVLLMNQYTGELWPSSVPERPESKIRVILPRILEKTDK